MIVEHYKEVQRVFETIEATLGHQDYGTVKINLHIVYNSCHDNTVHPDIKELTPSLLPFRLVALETLVVRRNVAVKEGRVWQNVERKQTRLYVHGTEISHAAVVNMATRSVSVVWYVIV
jgi:hypothetical protein